MRRIPRTNRDWFVGHRSHLDYYIVCFQGSKVLDLGRPSQGWLPRLIRSRIKVQIATLSLLSLIYQQAEQGLDTVLAVYEIIYSLTNFGLDFWRKSQWKHAVHLIIACFYYAICYNKSLYFSMAR